MSETVSGRPEILSKGAEMSASAEASDLIKRLAEPAPVGAHIRTLIRNVAPKVGISFERAKAIWYREARIISSDEMDALRAAKAAKDEAENAIRRKYSDAIERIEQLEHRLAEERSNHDGR